MNAGSKHTYNCQLCRSRVSGGIFRLTGRARFDSKDVFIKKPLIRRDFRTAADGFIIAGGFGTVNMKAFEFSAVFILNIKLLLN